MTETEIITFSEAARQMGVSRATISDVVTTRKLTPKRMNKRQRGAYFAKGLDPSDLQVIRQALGLPEPTATAS